MSGHDKSWLEKSSAQNILSLSQVSLAKFGSAGIIGYIMLLLTPVPLHVDRDKLDVSR